MRLAALLLAPLLTAATAADPLGVPPGRYVIDPAEAELVGRLSTLGGLSKVTMRFGEVAGGFVYDPASWARTPVTIRVDPASLATGSARLDRELKGPRHFHVARHPTVTLVSREIRADGRRGALLGDLTFVGVTRPVRFDFVAVDQGGDPRRLAFTGRGSIRRSDFGLTAYRGLAADVIDLTFDIDFVRR